MRRKKKKIANIKFIFIILLIVIFFINIRETKENKTKKLSEDYMVKNSYIENKVSEERLKNVTKLSKTLYKDEKTKEYPKENIVKNYKGYEVLAKLEIPVINLETYVLSEFSNEALNISVTRFWGEKPNEIGNLCIAGHNFINKNMFRNLKKLKTGDTFFLIDNNIGRVEYEVYDIFQVLPEDVSCLNQNTNMKEITLITCTSDSKKRIIVKAKERI